MMGRKEFSAVCVAVCLMVLSMTVLASQTDPNIISGLVRYNSSQAVEPNLVNGGLAAGVFPFADRTTLVFGDVEGLAGLDFIQTVMDDKTDDDVQYEVTVNKAGTLYLIIDNRVGSGSANDTATPPALGGGVMDWVQSLGFTQSIYNVNISTPAAVYELPVAGPGSITFGAQNDGGTRAMYVIAAAPAGWNLGPAIRGIPSSVSLAFPLNSLTIDGTLVDDGIPGTGLSVQWTTVSKPAGSSVQYAPDQTSEDVTVTFSSEGSYTLSVAVSDGEKTTEKTMQVTVVYPLYALQATADVEVGNDASLAPTSRSNGSGLGIRNVAGRRRVAVIGYNLSQLEPLGLNEVYANTFFSVRSTDIDAGTVQVYGVKEHLDNFDVNTTSWSTCPGLPNNPVPPLDTPVSLDRADLTRKLLEWEIPNPDNTRESSPSSAALADFINSDTDGTIVLLLVGENEGDNGIVRAINYTTSGTGYIPPNSTKEYHGAVLVTEKRVPTWVTKPVPANYSTASASLAQLSWTNPPEPVGAVTCDVYFGFGEPNVLEPHYGYPAIATGISGNSVTIPYALETHKDYYWIVDIHDDGVLTEGILWSFDTNNAYPTVNAGADQYIWLNNAGDPASATVNLTGSVTDDGLPSGILTRLWTQTSGPSEIIDPNGVIVASQVLADTDNVTLVIPTTGTYQFMLTGNDSLVTAGDSVQVVVAATPCLAAKAMPGYVPITGDLDGDCYVDIRDLAEFVAHWLECSSLAPCY